MSNEIELAKLGIEMYSRIFTNFGGWYTVTALVVAGWGMRKYLLGK